MAWELDWELKGYEVRYFRAQPRLSKLLKNIRRVVKQAEAEGTHPQSLHINEDDDLGYTATLLVF